MSILNFVMQNKEVEGWKSISYFLGMVITASDLHYAEKAGRCDIS
jgi:hypothetical protein